MGSSFGWLTTHHYYVHQHVNTKNEKYKKKLLVTLRPNLPQNPFLKLIRKNDPLQHCLISSLTIDTVSSEVDSSIEITVNLPSCVKEPLILEYPAYHSSVEEELLYKHELKEETIMQYAGLEDHIVSEVVEEECFPPTHPIISWFLLNRGILQSQEFEKVGDVQEMSNTEGERYYVLTREFASKCRNFFKDAILSKLAYTRFDDNTSIELFGAQSGTVSLTLMVEYFLVDKGKPINLKEITDEIHA